MFSFLTDFQEREIRDLAEAASDRAEAVLAEFGPTLRKAASFNLLEARKDSLIPGHPSVSYTNPKIGEFIAIVIDMRDSTKHLRQARSGNYSLVERVYLETAVLLPVCARAIKLKGGSVTEYTGDGLLALINVPTNSDTVFKRAYRCARTAVETVETVVNPIMIDRFHLDELSIGVGLSVSRAIVSAVGDPEQSMQDNAFGECVFLASKLSKWGRNQIVAHSNFRERYPESEGGKLKFRKHRRDDIDGYFLEK